MICAHDYFGLIEEPDWALYAHQFDESGFEIYSTRELVTVLGTEAEVSRDLEAKLNTSEALDQVRTRIFELSEYSDSLDKKDKDRLLRRWEDELAAYSEPFIGHSLSEWLAREYFRRLVLSVLAL